MAGAILGFIVGALVASTSQRARASNLVAFEANVNNLCPTTSCVSVLSWTIENWNQDVDIQLVSEKNGGGTQSFVANPDSAPGGIYTFQGQDTRIFYAGPGNYRLTLTILGNVTLRSTRTLEVNLLGIGAPILVRDSAWVVTDGGPELRRQVSSSIDLGFGSKFEQRFCKGARLLSVALVEANYYAGESSSFDLSPQDDPNAIQPNQVDIAIQRDGTTLDQFTYDLDGPTRQLPTPIDLDQPISLVGTRNSGSVPFYPNALVDWGLHLEFDCATIP